MAEIPTIPSEKTAILDLRNPEIYEMYPFLVPIREAIVCFFDYLELRRTHDLPIMQALEKFDNIHPNTKNKLALLLGLNPSILSNDPNSIPMEIKDQIEAANSLYQQTRGICELASKSIAKYLHQHYPDEFQIEVYESDNGNNTQKLTHFEYHFVAIVTHKGTELQMGISPANIFNTNLNLPQYKQQDFNRISSIIIGKNTQAILDTFQEIEGGDTWTKDTLDIDTYDVKTPYTNSSTNQKAFISLENFIQTWQDTE